MNSDTTSKKIWLPPAAVVSTIVLFATTFYIYAEGVRLEKPLGYLPIGIAFPIFMALMAFFTYVTINAPRKRKIGLTIVIILGETAVFIYAFMFLILNIFGS